MKVRNILLGITIVGAATIYSISNVGCASNKKEVNTTCDSAGTFTKVKSMLSTNCDKCHSAANYQTLGGSIKLATYDDVLQNVDTTSPIDITNSTFYTDINSGRMPKSGSKLDVCAITMIKNWITNGAKNN